MDRLRAAETMDAMTASALPYMEDEARQSTVAELQRRAQGAPARSAEDGKERWGGGYSGGVDSVSVDSFRSEIQERI